MNESLLKKEFKEKDIKRVRNLVNKNFTSNTQTQTGYQKVIERHIEGDVWEDGGKTWTIKNGLRQNVTKLDSVKKAARKAFIEDIEDWVLESLEDQSSYVTEQGDIESWNNVPISYKNKILEDLNGYIKILKEHT